MHKILLILVSSISIATSATAQNASLNCGNGRYVNDVFPAISKTTGIVFGYNSSTDYTTSTTFNHTLLLDFYEPAADPAAKRPLIILAFGGSFSTGQRSDMDALCMAFSKKGYATATIDYRLIQPGPSGDNYSLVYNDYSLLSDEVIKATADMKAAIRFFKRDAATTNAYKIDTSKIFIGGFSAGAITALQTAYINNINEYPALTSQFQANGGFEGNTDLPAPNNLLPTYNSTSIAGVLNLAGAVADTLLINATDPPVYTAQGDNDDVVPYMGGLASALYGGLSIHTRANNIGLASQLYAISGGSHTSPVYDPYFSVMEAGASAFFASIVCGPTVLPADNQSPHQAYISTTTTGNQAWEGELGMEFRVNNAAGIVVKQLGTFDHQGNGITGTQNGGIRVAIFNKATQSIVPGLDAIIIGNSDHYTANHRMKDIAPVTLMPGTYVIVSKGYHANELNGNSGYTGSSYAFGDSGNGAISFTGGGLYGDPNPSTFGYPLNADGGPANRYLAGTFLFDLPGTSGGGTGSYIVNISATDLNGNVAYATATVLVQDNSGVCNPSPAMAAVSASPAEIESAVTIVNEPKDEAKGTPKYVVVYPSPTNGSFHVQLYDFKAATAMIEIFNESGILIEKRQINQLNKPASITTVRFNLMHQHPGVYFIKVASTDGVQTAKVLIQR